MSVGLKSGLMSGRCALGVVRDYRKRGAGARQLRARGVRQKGVSRVRTRLHLEWAHALRVPASHITTSVRFRGFGGAARTLQIGFSLLCRLYFMFPRPVSPTQPLRRNASFAEPQTSGQQSAPQGLASQSRPPNAGPVIGRQRPYGEGTSAQGALALQPRTNWQGGPVRGQQNAMNPSLFNSQQDNRSFGTMSSGFNSNSGKLLLTSSFAPDARPPLPSIERDDASPGPGMGSPWSQQGGVRFVSREGQSYPRVGGSVTASPYVAAGYVSRQDQDEASMHLPAALAGFQIDDENPATRGYRSREDRAVSPTPQPERFRRSSSSDVEMSDVFQSPQAFSSPGINAATTSQAAFGNSRSLQGTQSSSGGEQRAPTIDEISKEITKMARYTFGKGSNPKEDSCYPVADFLNALPWFTTGHISDLIRKYPQRYAEIFEGGVGFLVVKGKGQRNLAGESSEVQKNSRANDFELGRLNQSLTRVISQELEKDERGGVDYSQLMTHLYEQCGITKEDVVAVSQRFPNKYFIYGSEGAYRMVVGDSAIQ